MDFPHARAEDGVKRLCFSLVTLKELSILVALKEKVRS